MMIMRVLRYSILWFWWSSILLINAETNEERSCDWVIWDSTSEVKGVQRVSVRCFQGQITWRTPYGGLGVTFNQPSRSVVSKLCFQARSVYARVKVMLEEENSLNSLFVLNSTQSSTSKEMCFTTNSEKPVLLYVEADSSATSTVLGQVIIEYDWLTNDASSSDVPSSDDPFEECRPCTDDEILLASCMSDYAVIGQLLSVNDESDSEFTKINIDVARVIRQKYLVATVCLHEEDVYWTHAGDRDKKRLGSLQPPHNHKSKNKNGFPALQAKDMEANGQNQSNVEALPCGMTVLAPKKCHVKKGDGLFIFLGKIRFRKARLQCAPRMEEFAKIWKTAIDTDKNPCVVNFEFL